MRGQTYRHAHGLQSGLEPRGFCSNIGTPLLNVEVFVYDCACRIAIQPQPFPKNTPASLKDIPEDALVLLSHRWPVPSHVDHVRTHTRRDLYYSNASKMDLALVRWLAGPELRTRAVNVRLLCDPAVIKFALVHFGQRHFLNLKVGRSAAATALHPTHHVDREGDRDGSIGSARPAGLKRLEKGSEAFRPTGGIDPMCAVLRAGTKHVS